MAALTWMIAPPSHAGEAVLYGPAPGWVAVYDSGKIDRASRVPIALLDLQQRIDGSTLTQYVDSAIKLDSTDALTHAGTVSAVWMPDKGDLTIHRVHILRGDQTIDVLEGGSAFIVLRRETNLEYRQLDGMLTATLSVPGLQLGDLLHVSYSQTASDPALGGNVQAFSVLPSAPVEASFSRSLISWPEHALRGRLGSCWRFRPRQRNRFV